MLMPSPPPPPYYPPTDRPTACPGQGREIKERRRREKSAVSAVAAALDLRSHFTFSLPPIPFHPSHPTLKLLRIALPFVNTGVMQLYRSPQV